MTYKYDTKRGCLLTALSISNTVIPGVLSSLEFWAFFSLHLVIFVSFRFGLLPETLVASTDELGLNWNFVKVVTSITTFFEVFYSNTCYARYTGLYKVTRNIFSDLTSFAYGLRTFVGERSPQSARMAVRYSMASIVLFFYNLKGCTLEQDLGELPRLGLFTPAELKVIMQQESQHRHIVAMSWASQAVSAGCAEADAKTAQTPLNAVLLKILAAQQEIADTLALPLPFQYFHLLSIMIIMNLVLWAYGMGLTDSIFAPIVYFFSALIFIGMMELASELSDPFGCDEVDFPVDAWLADCFEVMTELVETGYPGGSNGLKLAADQERPLPRGRRELSVLGHHGALFDGSADPHAADAGRSAANGARSFAAGTRSEPAAGEGLRGGRQTGTAPTNQGYSALSSQLDVDSARGFSLFQESRSDEPARGKSSEAARALPYETRDASDWSFQDESKHTQGLLNPSPSSGSKATSSVCFRNCP